MSPRTPNTTKFEHKRITNPSLPYVTSGSPTEGRPSYSAGFDCLSDINGFLARRNGFHVSPSTVTQIANPVRRYFFWERQTAALVFDQYIILSVTSGSTSIVYKLKIGTDTDFASIHTDSGSTQPFDYCAANNFLFFSNGNQTRKWDGTTVTNWGISPQPTTAPTASDGGAGSVPAAIGHYYVYAYGVSATGYKSDISAASTKWATANRQVSLSGARCTDTQCDKVHVYRTEDGGANMLELPNSPINNPGAGSWSMTDNATDDALIVSSPAPLRGVNQPPPAIFQPTFFAGRIWGFKDDKVYFSTMEENNTSIAEECFGTVRTNSYRFGRPVKGLGLTARYLLVYSMKGIFRIGGYSLSTFSRSTLSRNRGANHRQNICSRDDNVIWLDSSNVILETDGDSIGRPDISLPIRPDLASIDQSQSMVEVHNDGSHQWIILMDGANGKLYIFDMDTSQWMLPWRLSGCTAVASSTLSGQLGLFLARSGRSTKLNSSSFQDHDPATGALTSFTARAVTSLIQVNEDSPTGIDDVEYISIEDNGNLPSDVMLLADEDPASGTYTSIVANIQDPDQRVQGTALKEKWYFNRTVVPPCQRASLRLDWSASSTQFRVYTIDLVHRRFK